MDVRPGWSPVPGKRSLPTPESGVAAPAGSSASITRRPSRATRTPTRSSRSSPGAGGRAGRRCWLTPGGPPPSRWRSKSSRSGLTRTGRTTTLASRSDRRSRGRNSWTPQQLSDSGPDQRSDGDPPPAPRPDPDHERSLLPDASRTSPKIWCSKQGIVPNECRWQRPRHPGGGRV